MSAPNLQTCDEARLRDPTFGLALRYESEPDDGGSDPTLGLTHRYESGSSGEDSNPTVGVTQTYESAESPATTSEQSDAPSKSKQPAKSANKKRKVDREWRHDKRFSYSYETKAQAVLYFDQLRERDMAHKKHCKRVHGLKDRYDKVNEKFRLRGRPHCIKHWTSKKGRADINAALQGKMEVVKERRKGTNLESCCVLLFWVCSF